MKTAIVYHSYHHGNTRKLVQAMANATGAELFDLAQSAPTDLSGYDLVGLASGIYAFDVHPKLYAFLDNSRILPDHCFVCYTSGAGGKKFGNKLCKRLESMGKTVCGVYQCRGFDTFGPFGLVGGVGKGLPSEADLQAGVTFLQNIIG